MASCLGHAAHPFQLRAIQVVGSGNLRPPVVDALLALFQIVAVVAAIGIDGLIVEFKDHAAYPVEEEAVVGNHEQRLVAAIQETLQPFYHLQIQMVRGLIEYQEVRIGNQHIGQGDALLLAAAQLPHRLVEVTDLQLSQYLFGLEHLLRISFMIKAGVKHAFRRVESRRLFQHAHLQVTTKDDLTGIVALFSREDREQG